MDPKQYVETDTDLQAAQCREWMGREYCRANNMTAYPGPPDTWPGMHATPPLPPPANSYTLYYTDPLPKIGGGGVFELDDDVLAFATQAQTLSDGNSYILDLAANAKTAAQLSAAGQAAITPPEYTPPGG